MITEIEAGKKKNPHLGLTEIAKTFPCKVVVTNLNNLRGDLVLDVCLL